MNTKRIVTGVFALLVLFIGLFVAEITSSHTSYTGQKTLTIAPKSGSRTIGALLKREQFIRSKWAFVTYVSLIGRASSLKPGVYTFDENATIGSMAHALVSGGQVEQTIIIPEGWDSVRIAEYLESENITTRDAFLSAIADHARYRAFPFLMDKDKDATLEGYLFPDTYRIFSHATPEEIIITMLENFDKKLTTRLREDISRQNSTIFETVILASLIEKEVASDKDRAVVSGILQNRLRIGMPLQVDATISYITGKKTTKISREETKIDSPYNTYLYRGIPQGPIANPGLSALNAAVYPAQTDYFYYLSAPDGRTIFSRTLEQHNAAKAKYLR